MDYMNLCIRKLDEQDDAHVIQTCLYSSLAEASIRLASISHHTKEEWLATIVASTMIRIGHEEQVE